MTQAPLPSEGIKATTERGEGRGRPAWRGLDIQDHARAFATMLF